MKKTLRRIGSACGLATLFFGSSSAHAFCTEFDIFGIGVNCVDEGHKRITGYIKPILRDDIWGAVWNGNYAQDNPLGDFRKDGQRHFESCRFVMPRSRRLKAGLNRVHPQYVSQCHLLPGSRCPEPVGGSRQIWQAPAHGAGFLLPYQLDQSLEHHRTEPGESSGFVRPHAGGVAVDRFAGPRPGRHHPWPDPAGWSPGRVVSRSGDGFGDSRFHDE